jgi:hypothetical protein
MLTGKLWSLIAEFDVDPFQHGTLCEKVAQAKQA